MVKIKLVSFKNGIAIIQCFPDGNTNDMFELTLDVENQKILKNSLNEKGNAYAIHAAWKTFDIYASTETIPEEMNAIWN